MLLLILHALHEADATTQYGIQYAFLEQTEKREAKKQITENNRSKSAPFLQFRAVEGANAYYQLGKEYCKE